MTSSGGREKLWIVQLKFSDGSVFNAYPSAVTEEEARQKAVRFYSVVPEILSVQRYN